METHLSKDLCEELEAGASPEGKSQSQGASCCLAKPSRGLARKVKPSRGCPVSASWSHLPLLPNARPVGAPSSLRQKFADRAGEGGRLQRCSELVREPGEMCLLNEPSPPLSTSCTVLVTGYQNCTEDGAHPQGILTKLSAKLHRT